MKLLVLVKTYPNISVKYEETVCTAGILEDGRWIRLYPVPFRRLEYGKQYKKYQWIELKAQRSASDPRIESHRPYLDTLKATDETISTANQWHKRKQYVEKTKVYNDMEKLKKDARQRNISLATFKPKRVIKCSIKPKTIKELESDAVKIKKILDRRRQLKLFQDDLKELKFLITKTPFKFSYTFQDVGGSESTFSIVDWEIGQLYINCYKRSVQTNEEDRCQEACRKVEEKLEGFIRGKDLYFFLGTTQQFHSWGRNPFMIVGLFYPPIAKE